MRKIFIKNATLINEGQQFIGSLLIEGEKIAAIYKGNIPTEHLEKDSQVIEGSGDWLIPGGIDDQVHFREPGLTHKGSIATESAAAAAGGITSVMEMPNTKPQTTDSQALEWKFQRAAETSVINYSFYLGATNDNIEQVRNVDTKRVCGVKLFMGSSTGNMLVDKEEALTKIFMESPLLVAVHAEQESIIKANIAHYTHLYGENLDINFHSLIRSTEACYASSAKAVELATKHNGRLHLLHLSTALEMQLLEKKPLKEKRITGEVCIHHLWFNDSDYARLGNRIKWNPSIKTKRDQQALIDALNNGKLDIVATDHAPHLPSEKIGSCLKAASGGPLLQHGLLAMIEGSKQGSWSIETVVEKMSHAPAELFQIDGRGYLREGYYADLVLINPNKMQTITPRNIISHCGWSPFEGETFTCSIEKTFVNGTIAYQNGAVDTTCQGQELRFNR